jgi:hypothetical protein
MHLVNILRIITFSFLVGHSILTISDFNIFGFFGTPCILKQRNTYRLKSTNLSECERIFRIAFKLIRSKSYGEFTLAYCRFEVKVCFEKVINVTSSLARKK